MELVHTPGLTERSMLEITMKTKEPVLEPWSTQMGRNSQAFGKMGSTRSLGKITQSKFGLL